MQLDLDSKKKRGATELSSVLAADNLSTRTEREREEEGVKLLGAGNTLFGCASCGLLLLLLGSVAWLLGAVAVLD